MNRLITLCTLFLLPLLVVAQEAYKKKVYVCEQGDSLPYRLLRPEVERAGEKYPIILFLHGGGGRGNDNEKQLMHGGQMFLNPVNREKYPAFVLMPQCPEGGYWAYATRPATFVPDQMPIGEDITPLFRSLKALLDVYLALPQVDNSRVYIVGYSMGGMGTYDMAIRYPEIFAAAVPICGTVNPARLAAETQGVSFRLFHGDADDIVTVEGSRQAYKALKKAGVRVEYIEFPGIKHDSWTPAFNYSGFMEWLFDQRKK